MAVVKARSNRPGGVPPAPSDKRRRSNKPRSYGLSDVVTAGDAAAPPVLGFEEPHELVASMWAALEVSVEGQFYSEADWQRVRMELHHIDRLLKSPGRISSQGWAVAQSAFNDLMISPADKRRAGIELRQAVVDVDAEAAVSQLAVYQDRLTG